MRFLRVALSTLGGVDAFTIPGLAICGCLFENPALAFFPTLIACLLALLTQFVSVIASRSAGCCSLENAEGVFPLAKFSIWMLRLLAIGLLALACAFTKGLVPVIFSAAFLLLWLLCYRIAIWKNSPFFKQAFFAVKYVLCFLIGFLTAVAWEGQTVLNPWRCAIAMTFFIGILLYYYGIARASEGLDIPMPKRPGRFLFLFGCIISYAVLFGIVMRKPTRCWLNLFSGAASAIAAAVFVIVVYWCFRILQYSTTQRECRRWLSLLLFNIFFLQLATVTAFSSLWGVVAVAGLMALSLWTSKRLAKDGHGGGRADTQ